MAARFKHHDPKMPTDCPTCPEVSHFIKAFLHHGPKLRRTAMQPRSGPTYTHSRALKSILVRLHGTVEMTRAEDLKVGRELYRDSLMWFWNDAHFKARYPNWPVTFDVEKFQLEWEVGDVTGKFEVEGTKYNSKTGILVESHDPIMGSYPYF